MNKLLTRIFFIILITPALSYAAGPAEMYTDDEGITESDTPTYEKNQGSVNFAQGKSNTKPTPKEGTINEITTNDATTLITVSVIDHYDSNKKIKNIEICYKNIDSCKTTNKNGIATFTHNHIATEEISPTISVKPSSDYHCDEPIDTSASMNLDVDDLIIMGSGNYKLRQKNRIPADNTSFNFVVKCKQLCTDNDLKEVPNATACYVRGKKDYEILRCAADYTNIDNKCEPNPKLPVKEERSDTIGKVELKKTSEQKKLEEQVKQAKEQIKKLTQETIDKINNYCKEKENEDVCGKQNETINAINNAQDNALKKLEAIK